MNVQNFNIQSKYFNNNSDNENNTLCTTYLGNSLEDENNLTTEIHINTPSIKHNISATENKNDFQ